MSYLKKTIHGISWIGLLRGSTRGIAFLKVAVLARILTPEQFGLFGIAALVLALLEIFTETGINIFFVQKEAKLKEYIDTAWVISIARGISMSLILVLIAPFISTFFSTPDALQMILLMSLVPFIKGFINPSEIRFQSEMNFKKEFYFRFFLFFVDALVATIIAVITLSAVSIVWGLIIGALLEVVLSFLLLDPRPKFSFEKKKAEHILKRGKWLTGFGIFEYLFRNGDDIVVGKILGASSLGIYQMAYKLAILPITEVADVFGKVTLPIFVSIANEKERLRQALIKTTLVVIVLLLPIIIILSLIPEMVITITLGNQWISAAGILRILVFYAFIRAIINPALTVFLAVKKQEYVAIISILGTVSLFIIIFPLLQLYGITGIAIATIISSLVTLPLVVYYSWKLLK